MAGEVYIFDATAEAHIQACLLADEVPEPHLQALEQMLRTNSDLAKALALRLLDDRLIRNWFRSEADPSFIDQVRRRLELHFDDPAFVAAAMGRIEDAIFATAGAPGATVRKEPSRRYSAFKYLLAPLGALVLYMVLAHGHHLLGLFHDTTNEVMTVQDFTGEPRLLIDETEKSIIRKMLVRPGSTVVTTKAEQVSLTYPDETRLTVAPASRLVLHREPGRKRLELLTGAIELTVAPQKENAPLLVETPNGEVSIAAGHLRITLLDDVDRVIVLAGTAQVRKLTGGDPIPVEAGRQADVRARQIIVEARD